MSALILGYIGIGLVLLFAFVPTRAPKQLSQAGLALGILLAGAGLGLLAVQVRDLTAGVHLLAARYAVLSNTGSGSTPSSPAAAPETMKMMDDRRLRSRVAALAHEMCDFEHKFQSDELERKLNRTPAVGTQEEVKRQWQAEANVWRQRYGDYENEFRKRFLADALAYREEMLRRLKTVPPDEERQLPALHGNLTGLSPICDFGVYLESLAIQLAP
jgi:hypothetical protein